MPPESPFAAIVRDFPYRAPPRSTSSESLAQLAHASPQLAEGRTLAPVALTASDGAGLEVKRLEARVVIDSMLAFTELRLSFLNPEAREREGRFTLQLPAGAAISRLAMKVNGVWQEAEVVERQRAHRVYEDFLHYRQDPALFEKKAGNEFSARVFPIPPKAEKELIVSYSEELERREYRLPLAGMPRIKELAIRAQVLGEPGRSALLKTRTEQLHEYNVVPEQDFRVPLEKPFVALTSGQLVAIPVPWTGGNDVEPLPALAIAFDTSASRALDLDSDVKRLGELIVHLGKLHPSLDLALLAFDQDVRPIWKGKARDLDPKALDRLRGDRALGASNLSIALAALNQSDAARVALFSDAMTTAGALEPRSPAVELASLEARGARLDVILSGGAHDREAARALVRGGGRVLSAELSGAELASKLSLAPAPQLTASLPDAEWVQPAVLEGLVPGEIRTIHARLRTPASGPLRVTLTTIDHGNARPAAAPPKVLTVPARAGERLLLERSLAAAEIRRVTSELAAARTGPTERASLKGTIIDLSRRYRVLSDWTALLVLETDADYASYGIDRNALTDIIGVGERGLTRLERASPNAVSATGGQLEQLTAEDFGAGPSAELEPVRPPQATSSEGYGYEFSHDPLNDIIPIEPRAGATNTGVDEICAIDPGACSGVDMNKELRTDPLAETNAVREEATCPSGSLRRWAAGVPRRVPCGRPLGSVNRPRPPDVLVEPYSGRFAKVMGLIAAGDVGRAQREALAWRDTEPLDTLALVALGEALEAAGNRSAAARAYGSLIDLYPSRADMRRFAAGRLERLGLVGRRLSEDSYRRALELRPDQVTGHQLLAYSLLRQGRAEAAFAVLEALADSHGVRSHELREDLRLFAAVLVAREPKQRARALELLARYGLTPEHGPSTRLLLTWETDTNDVDLHLVDRHGEHAFYEDRFLPGGSRLLTDVTTGYGPEEFVLAPAEDGAPYEIFVHYYERGVMGFGMGKVDIIGHDGNGNVSAETRPFVIVNENAAVHLGRVDGPWPR